MRFEPKSEAEIEKEIAARGPWPRGSYDFEVATAGDDVSSKGNDMIVLELLVYNPEGETKKIKDYLLASNMPKLRAASAACGMLDKYDNGYLTAENFIGRSGQVKLKVKKDNTGQYPDKNEVDDYVASSTAVTPPPRKESVATGALTDDEIPF